MRCISLMEKDKILKDYQNIDFVETKLTFYDNWDIGIILRYTLVLEWILILSAFSYYIWYIKKILRDQIASNNEVLMRDTNFGT